MADNAQSSGGGSGLGAAVVSATQLRLSYGAQVILDEATLAVHERDKIGVVGRNGCGKSSFMKILAGEEQPDAGEISVKSGLVIGFLSQEFTLREDETVMENIRDGARWLLDAVERYETADDLSAAESEALLNRIEVADGWNFDNRAESLCRSLGAPDADRIVSELSGGEKRRVALCRALASNPDFLILDEPTNHLDAETIEWLEGFLKSFAGACLFVTHDRYFLERVATRIAELDGGKFFSHEGNYDDYLEAKAIRQEVAAQSEHKRQRFLRSELEWVRAGVKARGTKARSRLDKFYEVAEQDAPEEDLSMDLVLPPAPRFGNTVLDLEGVGAELGGKRLFSALSHQFEAGRCAGVVGRNGLGKTTLLRVLMGEMEPTEGKVTIGKRTKFNYVDQSRAQLNGENSILEEVSDGSDFVAFGGERLSVRGYLKRFLFSDERINERVDTLSGGERSRVMLAKILRTGGNFLILDEPTNDLDLATLRVLEEAIIAFQGTVLVVSHDRFFLDRVADQIVAFEGDGRVRFAEGNWSYYREKFPPKAKAKAKSGGGAGTGARSASAASTKAGKAKNDAGERSRKLTWKEERELESIEPEMEKLEARVVEIETTLSDPDFYKTRAAEAEGLDAECQGLKQKIETMFARWEELEAVRVAGE
jgi:ATP-binding cassette subfamily F protein uup